MPLYVYETITPDDSTGEQFEIFQSMAEEPLTKHPQTGLPMRMYDTRSFDRVAQVQHSLNEIELLAADGSVQAVHRSEVSSRYVYKHEMELLLRIAGFKHWEIYGDFDGHPLLRENDAMVVTARNA